MGKCGILAAVAFLHRSIKGKHENITGSRLYFNCYDCLAFVNMQGGLLREPALQSNPTYSTAPGS